MRGPPPPNLNFHVIVRRPVVHALCTNFQGKIFIFVAMVNEDAIMLSSGPNNFLSSFYHEKNKFHKKEQEKNKSIKNLLAKVEGFFLKIMDTIIVAFSTLSWLC